MSDPRRIAERTGLAGALLRAGAEELPSDETVRKVALAMGTGAAIASSSAATAASVATGAGGSALSKASAPFTFAVLGKWLGIGTLTGLVTVTSASQIERARSHHVVALQPAPMATTSPIATTPTTSAAADVPTPAPIESLPVVSPPASVSPPRVESPRAKVDRNSAPSAAGETTPAIEASETATPVHPDRTAANDSSPVLAAEIAFVDGAWQNVQRGNAERALVELAGYEARFPDLRLHPEVLFLRMEAETQLGHTANAVSLARRIVLAYPKSAQATRARSVLAAP
jgi:hypothetical protein